MLKLTTECAFQLNQNLYKQKDYCRIGGTLSVKLSVIHKIRTKVDLFFNWDSLHARQNSRYKAWRYKKRKQKKVKAYRKSV